MRPWFNAGFCLLLLGLGWATQLAAGYPFGELDPLGPWATIPAVIGTLSIAACTILCFVVSVRTLSRSDLSQKRTLLISS